MPTMPDTNLKPFDFWEQVYHGSSPETSGRPSTILERFAADRAAGAALDLGCAKGDDAVWLAKRGWQVTAVDISITALDHAKANANRNGVADRINFLQVDLGESFPEGNYDLVSAMFLETPLDFPRDKVLRNAALTLNSGGVLLLVSHGSVAPWSWGDKDRTFPTARECLAGLDLDATQWNELCVDSLEREARGPGGQTAMVRDTVIALERR